MSEPSIAEEKKYALFLRQKRILDTFLKNGAITKAQYDKSFGDLAKKMGYADTEKKTEETPCRF